MKQPKARQDMCIPPKEDFRHLYISFKYILYEDYKQVYSELYRVEMLDGNVIKGLT